jgi:cellulose synthase/poly-beta-1,6-N-acetylglucosamine synthase-like glycosyltransferase
MPVSAAILFWTAVFLLVYTYVGYGALAWVWARVRPRSVRAAAIQPSVTVVVAAFNEAGRVAARIENLLALDYPRDRLEIVIASDGSTDNTVEIARTFGPGVRVEAFPVRRGKPAMLNDVVPAARGEIVVLADARQRFDRGALQALVRSFGDPMVGAVSGELLLLKEGEPEPAVEGAAVYWSYEKLIRQLESRADSTVGATGAIYAIRRDLFRPIADETVLDDVVIPMNIARLGFRVLFEPAARAYDRCFATDQEEFTRKVRTMAGNFQMFASERWLLNPAQNRLWLQTISHKALRLVLPAMYATVFVANLALLDTPFYQLTMAGQVAFVAVAAIGYAFPRVRGALPLIVVPYAICFLTWATVVGFVRFIAGRQRVTWERSTATP